jgi:mitochondrial fission protein ELM1
MTELRKAAPTRITLPDTPTERVWVLDDPRAGTANQVVGIAERLGLPFRRIPLTWNAWTAHIAGLVPGGSLIGLRQPTRGIAQNLATSALAGTAPLQAPGGPDLVLSAGRRSAAVALWMKSHFGCRIIHFMSSGMGGLYQSSSFDLLVMPEHDRPRPGPNRIGMLGAPHRVSPLVLQQAEAAWHERLAHLPHPRVVLVLGGPPRGVNMPPAIAHTLGRRVARLVAARGGSVLATTSRRTGEEATEALSAGLASCMHLLYRWGEPGENPYHGFLACADAVVVTNDSTSMVSEACATTAPIFLAARELANRRQHAFAEALYRGGHARPLGNNLSPWKRPPLDEVGRIADEIRHRFLEG